METIVLPNSMISSFFRSTRNLSSVHSGSGGAVGPLESSSDTGRGESALRSLLEPGSDCCCKYPLKGSHWAAMTSQSTADSPQQSDQIIPAERAPVIAATGSVCDLHGPEEYKVKAGKSRAPPIVQYEPEEGWMEGVCHKT